MTNKNKSVKTINKKEKVDIFKLIREKKEEKKKLLEQTGGSAEDAYNSRLVNTEYLNTFSDDIENYFKYIAPILGLALFIYLKLSIEDNDINLAQLTDALDKDGDAPSVVVLGLFNNIC